MREIKREEPEQEPTKKPKTDWSRVERIIKEQENDVEVDTPQVGAEVKDPIKEQILFQEIEQVKKGIAESREKMGLTKTAEELEKEEIELRKKFGIK